MSIKKTKKLACNFLSEKSRDEVRGRLSAILNEKPHESLILVFCGTFSSGKSSLINALLCQQFKLPAGINPVTKLVTRLKYGRKFEADYILEGAEYSLNQSELAKYIKGELPLPAGSREIVIKLPAEILKGGVEILDTPGYMDNEDLTEITRAAVITADVAFFCCHATAAGKKFELDYFEELEESIGNFCVIINHIDSINYSIENFEQIKNFMEGNIGDRGRAIIHYITDEKIFYTIADGDCPHVEKFKNFTEHICCGLSKKFRRRLQRFSYQKRTMHNLKMLQAEVRVQIQSGDFFYSCASEEIELEYQKAKTAYLAKCREIAEWMEKFQSDGLKFLKEALASIEREFDSLEATGCFWEFQERATAYLCLKLSDVPTQLKAALKNSFPELNLENKNFFANYFAAVKKYNVPEPVSKRVKSRSASERVLWTILNVITFEPEIDDGYDTLYENYAKAAKVHLQENLAGELEGVLKSCFIALKKILMPELPAKDSTVLEEFSDSQRAWKILAADIKKKLDFCQENFFWKVDINRRIFPS